MTAMRNGLAVGASMAVAVMVATPWSWQLEQLRIAALCGLIGATLVWGRAIVSSGGRRRVIALHADALVLPSEWPWRSPIRVPYERLRAVAATHVSVVVETAERGHRFAGSVELPGLTRALAAHGPSPQWLESFHRRSFTLQRVLERGAPATGWLIALLLLAYLAQTAYGPFDDPVTLSRVGAGSGVLVANGQWYRVLVACFLHLGPGHLLSNLGALWLAGRKLEPVIGGARLLVIFLVAAMISALVTLPLPVSFFLGASGGVLGIVVARGVLEWQFARDMPMIQTSRLVAWDDRPWYVDACLGLIGALWTPNLNWPGHLGGMLGGAVCVYVLVRGQTLLELLRSTPRAVVRSARALCLLSALCVSMAAAHAARGSDADLLSVLATRKTGDQRVRRAAAHMLSACEHASLEDARWARDTLQEALSEAPSAQDAIELRWALATLSQRLADRQAAIHHGLEALDRGGDMPPRAGAAFLHALQQQLETHGVLQLTAASGVDVELQALPDSALSLTLHSPLAVELLALAEQRGRPIGLLRIWVGASSPQPHTIRAEPGAPHWPADTTFSPVLLRSPQTPHQTTFAWRYRALTPPPSAAALLARLAP